jgi:hypothetical protein
MQLLPFTGNAACCESRAHFVFGFEDRPYVTSIPYIGTALRAPSHIHRAQRLVLFAWTTVDLGINDRVNEIWPLLWSSGQSSWLQNGDVLCFLWGTNWIYICYVEEVERLRGLVVRVPSYKSRSPRSIPGATRFSEKQLVWNGVHSASWVQLTNYLKEKLAAC